MSLRDFYDNLKAKVFGRVAEDILPPELQKHSGLDIGPARRWYIKRLFPRGVFTKKLTPARIDQVREVFRTLRNEQKVIARRHGYNRGLDL